MDIVTVREILLCCSIVNLGLFFIGFLALQLWHDAIYRLHSKWFAISVEQFDVIHYVALAFFKIFILVFNLVPYVVLLIVTT